MEAVMEYYKSLGSEYEKALCDMFVLDAVICNTDRHFGNFGFFIDSKTNRIIAPAPLFDHGNSLFNYAGEDDFASEETLSAYVITVTLIFSIWFFSIRSNCGFSFLYVR